MATRSLSVSVEQTSLLTQAISALEGSLQSLEGRVDSLDLGDQLRAATEEAQDFFDTNRVSGFQRALTEVAGTVTNFTKQLAEARTSTVSMTGAVTGFLGGLGVARTALAGFGGLMKTVFSVGRSVLGAFRKTVGAVFGLFYGALTSGGGGGTGLREALNEIRKEFGALTSVTGQQVIAVARRMREEVPRSLAFVGRHFADTLKTAIAFAQALGPLFQDAISESVGALGIFQHGLGASDEDLRRVAQQARATGQEMTDIFLSIARESSAAGAAIGVSGKIIARSMFEARKNVALFGDVTDRELAASVARFHSLGLEIENVNNLLSNVQTFEDAANVASQLTAAFGAQVDVFQLVSAENPADQLEILRQSMMRTGRTAENFSRRELGVLGQALGETDLDIVRMAFSAENAGMSLEQIRQGAAESGEQTKSMEEVLTDLTAAIERTIGSGGRFNTFLEAMSAGIQRGIRRFLWQTGVMRDYRRALRETYRGFRELTTFILENFPGMERVIEGVRALLDPQNFRDFFSGIREAFQSFFDMEITADELFRRILDTISNFLNAGGDGFRAIMEGGRTILRTLGQLIAAGLRQLSEYIFGDPREGLAARLLNGVRDALRFLAQALSPDGVQRAMQAGGDFAESFFGGFLGPIVEFFRSPEIRAVMREILQLIGQALMNVLRSADDLFRRMTGEVLERMGVGFLVNAEGRGPGIMASLLGVLFGPAVIGAVVGPIMQVFARGLLGSLGGALRLAGRGPAGAGVGQALTQAATNVPRGAGAGVGNLANATAGAAQTGRAASSLGAINTAALAQAVVVAGLIVAVAYALFPLFRQINRMNLNEGLIEKIGAFGLLAGTLTIVAGAIAGLGALMAGPQAAFIVLGAAAVTAIGAVVGAGTLMLINQINAIDITPQTIRVLEILPGFFAGLGAVMGAIALMGAATVIPTGAIGIAQGVRAVGNLLEQVTDSIMSISEKTVTLFRNVSPSQLPQIESGMRFVVDFVGAIGPLLGALGEVLRSSRAGFGGGLLSGLGRGRQIRNTLEGVNEFLRLTVSGSDSAVQSLLSTVTSTFSGLDQTAIRRIAQGVEIVTSLIETITPALEAMGAVIESSRGGVAEAINPLSGLTRGRSIRNAVEGVNAIVAQVFGGDGGTSVIDELLGHANRIGGMGNMRRIGTAMESIIVPAVTAVVELMGSASTLLRDVSRSEGVRQLGSIGRAIVDPVGNIVNAFRRPENQRNDPSPVALLESLIDVVADQAADMISRIVTKVSSLDLPTDLGWLDALGPIFEFVTNILDSAVNLSITIGQNAAPTIGLFRSSEGISTEQIDSIKEIISTVGDVVSDIVSEDITGALRGLLRVVADVQLPEGSDRSIAAIGGIMQAIGGVVSTLVEASRSEALQFLSDQGEDLTGREMRAFRRLVREGGADGADIGGLAEDLTTFIGSVGPSINTMLTSLSGATSQFGSSENLSLVASGLESVFNAVNVMLSVASSVGGGPSLDEIPSFARDAAEAAGVGGGGGLGVEALTDNFPMIVDAMGTVVDSLVNEDRLDPSRIATADERIQAMTGGFMENLRDFFDQSNEVFGAVADSAVVELPEAIIRNLRTVLPAAAAAVEASEIDFRSDNLSVALAGTTFNFAITLEVDGERLAQVVAERTLQP